MGKTTDRLISLGKTAEDVALSLLVMGFRGHRKRSDCCPIIKFVNSDPDIQKWGGMSAPHPGVVTWNDPQTMDPIVPRQVSEFMRRFDDGEFSDLTE